MAEQEWEDRAAEPSKLFAIGAEGSEGTEKSEVIQLFEGVYLTSKVTTMNNGSLLHVFQRGKETVGVWGFHRLDKALEEIPPNTRCKIEYLDTVKLEKGRTMKTVKVLVPPGTKRLIPSTQPF